MKQVSKISFIVFVALGLCAFIGYVQDPFITVWESSSSGVSNTAHITIPAHGEFTYTWSEVGNETNAGSGSGTDQTTITFPSPETYEVKMTPTGTDPFHRFVFPEDGEAGNLTKVKQWGDVAWSSFKMAFKGAYALKITTTDIPDLSNVTDMSEAFSLLFFNGYIPNIENWDVSNVTNMQGMFGGCLDFDQPIGNWDVSNVTNMAGMFSLTSFNQPIGNWDVSSVTTMESMFAQDDSFNQPIGNWDVGNVENMEWMFSMTPFNQPIGNWDVSNVTTMAPHVFPCR